MPTKYADGYGRRVIVLTLENLYLVKAFPWRRAWQTTPYSCLEKQASLAGYSQRVAQSLT